MGELTTWSRTPNKHKRRKTMPSVGFEPAIPATKRSQNYALDRTATGISKSNYTLKKNFPWSPYFYFLFNKIPAGNGRGPGWSWLRIGTGGGHL